jgi:hypothetical protein
VIGYTIGKIENKKQEIEMTPEERAEIKEQLKHLIRIWNQAEEMGYYPEARRFMRQIEFLQNKLYGEK